jgi:hypothetical protein
MASSVGVCPNSEHPNPNSTTSNSPHSCSLRFELGGGDSSASSLNGGHQSGVGGPCSQCSSANSLHRTGSIRHRPIPRGRLNTTDGYTEQFAKTGCEPTASGSLPKLVSLVPPSFPPASSMLSSSDTFGHNPGEKDRKEGNGKRPKELERSSRVDGTPKLSPRLFHQMAQQVESDNVTPLGSAQKLCPSSAVTLLRRDPARLKLAATKQRSSSESAFSAIPKVIAANYCTCKNCQQQRPIEEGQPLEQRASFAGPGADCTCCRSNEFRSSGVGGIQPMRRPDSMSAISSQNGHQPCSAIALLMNNEREQAILQRILGPAGLGWLKRMLFL